MGHFDEVCFFCGASPIPPTGFTNDSGIAAAELVSSLLERYPSIVEECDIEGIGSKDDLENYIADLMDEFEDFSGFAGVFGRCIAIGYFDDDGDVPYEEVPTDPVIKRKIPDGKFVATRVVADTYCGSFREVVLKAGEAGVLVEERRETITRTGAYYQEGIGNFFLSEPCYLFLQSWIILEDLPPMWNDRELSFPGELWEVINSREIGRNRCGWLDWLDPGGAEKKLEQTQYELATGGPLSFKVVDALRRGDDKDLIKLTMLDDYGLWMFANPHEWPHLDDLHDMITLTDISFDVPTRSSSSSSLGAFSLFSPEDLVKIFGWLSSVGDYLNLKAVSRRMYDLIADSKFTAMVFREMLQPDQSRCLYWAYPVDRKPAEQDTFTTSLRTWLMVKLDTIDSIAFERLLFSQDFPIVQFVYALHTEDSTRNRRRLWNNAQNLRKTWVDYRLNGWKVNRFGVAYPGPER